MKKSIIARLDALELSNALQAPVEIWDLYTMPDGKEIKTQDKEEGKRLEALGGIWDLLIIVRGA